MSKTKRKPRWRMLRVGEKIRKGDEFRAFRDWRKACLTIGGTVIEADVGDFRTRRPLPKRFRK